MMGRTSSAETEGTFFQRCPYNDLHMSARSIIDDE